MNQLLLITCMALVSSCSARKTATGENKNNAADTVMVSNNRLKIDSALPACIIKLISNFNKEEKQMPPRSIIRYTYNGKTVYYVPPICCDFFSDLYDDSCKLIAHPDGGFTGRGDGRAADFIQAKSGEKLIWKDER